ncbi:MAG: helix-turn-helix domain-containing protein, partial [Phascolarctobacterium sp.]|nr:helix-turn-helix domain-containing protein [Phascolarctobacterium sp.]
MAFTFEEKLKVVKLVCEERLSFLAAGRNIGASKSTVLAWVQLVREHGIEALKERHNS